MFIKDFRYVIDVTGGSVASVVEWSVCSTAVREGTGSIPAGANVVIPVFPPKATCPLSSDEYLAL